MAADALSIPFDITWSRLAWSRDMVDKRFGGGLPPKWRSSMAVYGFAVPLAETEADYPDSRVLYLKLSCSITGWTPREALEGNFIGAPSWDPWQQTAWEQLAGSQLGAAYWPCVSAIAQIAVYPRPEEGTPEEDYPYIVDFEPKKRELYEAVTDTGEVLSGSRNDLNVRRGRTTTEQTEHELSASTKAGVNVGVVELGGSAGYNYTTRSGSENVHVQTADASTERRETVGRSTQLAQMYQLFNGYHVGTNRAVFVILPRPHTRTAADQLATNLINGERRLEGVQDVFLVVQVPRTVPGICVQAFLDTGHKLSPDDGRLGGLPPSLVITRRTVGGCAELAGDRFRAEPPPIEPPRIPPVVGEGQIGGWRHDFRKDAMTDPTVRDQLVNELNFVQGHIRDAALSAAASGAYAPRDLVATSAFQRMATVDLRGVAMKLAALEASGYLSASERAELVALKLATAGDVFAEPTDAPWPAVVTTVRQRLLDAVVASATKA